jgi:hypothetical protein
MDDKIQELKEKLAQEQAIRKDKEKALENLEAEKGTISATLEQKLSIAKGKLQDAEKDLNTLTRQRDKARQKLESLKNHQKELVQKAQKKQVCLTLVKYTPPISIEYENDNYQEIENTSNSLFGVIADTQNHLGVSDLTQLTTSHPMPEGKSLSNLIEFYLDNKDNSPTPPSPTPPLTKLASPEPNETLLIVNQIINECDLGLNQNSSLTQVIKRIKKLIKVKPPLVQSVIKNETPFGESLEKIIRIDLHSLEKELGINLSKKTKQQFEKVNNYQELSLLRNQEIKSYLEKNQGVITTQPTPPSPTILKEERVL